MAMPWVAQAQNTLTVADGTATNSNVPVYGLYVDEYLRCQTIYPASMIEEAADAFGMNGGSISSMTFYLSSSASASWGTANFVVRLTEVSATTLSTWADVTNATTVYEGSLDGTQSTMTVNFTTPYTYNGGNLLLEVYSTATGSWKSASFRGVAATGASWQGHSSSAWTAVSGSAQNFIPKTTFTFTGGSPITCRVVSNITASSITDNSAVITWADLNNTGASYTIYNGDQVMGTVPAGTYSYTATGLTGNTEYTLSVVANCSETDASAAKGVTFRTECSIISQLPYSNNFENEPSGSNLAGFPFCWTRYNDATSTYYNYYPYVNNVSASAHSGSKYLYFYTYNSASYPTNQMAIMPEVDVTTYPMNQNMVTFWARAYSTTASYATSIEVGTMSDPTDMSTFVIDSVIPLTSTTYTKYMVKLNKNTVATNAYVALRVVKGGSNYKYAYVDDVTIEQMPSCWPVSGLALGTVTNNSVELTWNGDADNPAATTYSVYNGETLVEAGVTSPYVVTGLQPLTNYTFSVVANCAADDPSEATSISARTACPDVTPIPYVTNFDDMTSGSGIGPECWANVAGNNYVRDLSTSAHSGNNFLNFQGTTTGNIVAMPAFDQEISTLRLSFWTRPESYSNNGCGNFSVGYMTDVEDPDTYVEVAEILRSEWTANEYHFHQYVMTGAPAGARMAFRQNANSASWYWYVDDVTVEVIPTHTVSFNYLTLAEGVVAGTAAVTAGNGKWGSEVTMTSTPVEDMRTAAWYAGNITDVENAIPLAEDVDQYTFTITSDTTFTVAYGFGQFEIKGIFANDNQARMGTIEGNSPYGNDKYDYATTATLTATANRGFQFVEWRNEDGTFYSTENPLTLTATQAYTFVAHFAVATYDVTATGEHGTFTGTGTYNYGELATIQAVPDLHYHFVKWSDESTNNPRNYRVTADMEFTAIFEPDVYTVAMHSNAPTVATYAITNADEEVASQFAYNTQATATATVTDNHYTFASWKALVNKTVHWFELDGTIYGYADYFGVREFYVYNEDDVEFYPTSAFEIPTGVTINDINWFFVAEESTENPFTFTVTDNTTMWPVFTAEQYTLTIASNDDDMGNVSFTNVDIIGNSVTADYRTRVQVTAETNNNYSQFVGWYVADRFVSDQNTIYAYIDSTYTLTAHFSFTEYPVTTAVMPTEAGTVSYSTNHTGNPVFNDDVVFTATANEHWVFDHFVGTDGENYFTNPYTEIMFDALNVTAVFVRDTHTVVANVLDATHGDVTVYNDDDRDTNLFIHGHFATVEYTDNNQVMGQPGYGYYFTGWYDGDEPASTDNPYRFEVEENVTLTAHVAKLNYGVNVYVFQETGETFDRGTAQADAVEYPYLTAINGQLTNEANYGYVFDHWANEAGEVIELPFTLVQDTDIYAHFRKDVFTVQAKVPADYRMMGRVAPATSEVEFLDDIELTATPNYGYHFDKWVDAEGNAIVDNPDVVLNGNVLTLSVTKDTIFYATFDYNTYSVEGATNDANMGNVVVNNQALNPVDLSYSQTVTLNAEAEDHYHFREWQDGETANPRTFILTQDTVFTAIFAIDTLTVDLRYAEEKVEDIVIEPLDINGEMFEVNRFVYGTEVYVDVTPAYGYTFDGWSHDGQTIAEVDHEYVFDLTQDTVLMPLFTTNQYTVTVASADDTKGAATVNNTTDVTVDYLSNVTLVATPEYGYDFVNWKDANEDTLISTEANYTYKVKADVDIVANFTEHRYEVIAEVNDEAMGTVEFQAAPAVADPLEEDAVLGDSTGTTTNIYLPGNSLYDYALSQQIYTAEEIGGSATFKSLTMWLKNSSSYSRNVEIYMKEIQESSFASNTSWVSLSSSDLVATATIANGVSNPIATTFTLTTPFQYTGNGNLLLCVRDVTGSWSSGLGGLIYNCASNQAIYAYRDNTSYDVSTPGVNGTRLAVKNVIKLGIVPPTPGAAADDDVVVDINGVAHVKYNKNVIIVATENEHYDFVDWTNAAGEHFTDNPLTVTVVRDSSFTANFVKEQYTITVATADALQGSVAITGNSDNDTIVDYNEQVELVATPVDVNHRFLKWVNNAGDEFTTNPLTVTAEKNDTYTATFGYQVFTLTAATEDINKGGVYVDDPNNVPAPITVADGTADNGYVPILGTYVDTYGTKGQSIYPASMLTNMNGGDITTLTYYLKNPATVAWNATVEVKLTEVEQTSFASDEAIDVTAATAVYTGVINANASTMTITLNQPYTYNGGNLLVDFTVTATGTYKSATFYGINSTEASNASYYEYEGYSGMTKNRLDFLPKVTFAYGFSNVPSLANSSAVVDYGTDVDIYATPAEHYHFNAWKNAADEIVSANAHETITVAGDSALTATFTGDDMPVVVTPNVAIRGTVAGSGNYEYNTQTQISATAAHGYVFSTWNDGNEDNPRTITVGLAEDNNYTAIFDYQKFNVDVTVENGTVSVTNDMADAQGDIFTDVEAIHSKYFYGQNIELTFTANEHYHFTENGQSTYVVTLSTLTQPEPLNIVAVIDQQNVTVASNDVTMGTVTVNDVEGNYSETLDYGTELALVATPAEHHHFVKWSDDVEDAERTITVETADINLTAIFALNSYDVVAAVAAAEMGDATVSAVVETEVLSEGFEGGVMPTGWTNDGDAEWTVGTGDDSPTTGAHSGTMNAKITHTNTNDKTKLVTPAIDLSTYEGAALNFWFINRAWAGDKDYLKVYYRAAATDEWTLIPGATYSTAHATWTEASFDLTNLTATYQLAFEMTDQYGHGVAIDDVTITGTSMNVIPAPVSVAPFTQVAFTATANAGYEFANWNDGNTDNPRMVIVDQDTTLTASFSYIGYTVTLNSNNEVMGNASVAPEQEYYHIGEVITLTATPEYGYKFINWSDDNTDNPRTITMGAANVDLTANFNFDNFDLNVTVAEGQEERGTVLGAGNYPYGTEVQISAVANDGYLFLHWNDGVTNAVRTVTVNGHDAYVASFRTDATYTVAVDAENGNVSGTGSNFIENDQVTLTATPAMGYRFVNWTTVDGTELSEENPYSFTVVSDTHLVAVFAALPYTVTLNADPEQGTVTGAGEYLFGQQVTISATPAEGYLFEQWSDDVTTNPRTIVVTSDIELTAIFSAIPPTLYYIGATAVNGTVTGTGMYEEGTTVTLTATPNTCYHFVNWTKDGVVVSEDAAYSFTVTENMTLMANFEATVIYTDAISETACVSYTWHGIERTATNIYTFDTVDAQGCAVVETLNLTINTPIVPEPEEQTACVSYTWHGTEYTTSGTYTYPTTDINGCDVNETLELTINTPIIPVAEDVTECTSYTWHGTEYTTSGTYTFPTTDVNGCAVNETLNLTILGTQTETVAATVCDSIIWNGSVYNTTGTYTFETTAVNGCDSIVTLNLTVNYSVAGLDTVATSCGAYTWRGETYVQSGDYHVALTAANGCDSVLTLHLTVNNDQATTVEETACDSLFWNGQMYTISGNYPYHTTSAAGCDSTVTLVLTINASSHIEVTTTAVDHFEWNDSVYTESGDYTWTGTNAAGCDSVVVLHLTIVPQTYTLTVNVNNPNMGRVNPAGVIEDVVAGTTVTLTATANDGFRFVDWSNGATTATIEVTVESDTTLTANFEAILYTITATANDETMGTVTGSAVYQAGATVVLEATANNGYHFVRWSDGTTNAHYEFTATADVNLIAYFEANTQGIDDVEGNDANIYSVDNMIVVKGAENLTIYVYDVNGRCVRKQANATETVEFTMSSTGVYLVKVGDAPAKRVVVVR